MRYYFLILFVMFVIAAYGKAPTAQSNAADPSSQVNATQQQKPSTDEVVQYLLASAAQDDFHDHGPAGQLRFRDVRIGRNKKGVEMYRMCGQFQKVAEGGGKAEWLYFATVKTSGYEQYVGGQTSSFCKDIKWIQTIYLPLCRASLTH